MQLFVQVLRGSSPSQARPVLVTSDPTVIGEVIRALKRTFDDELLATDIDHGHGRPSMAGQGSNV